MASIMSLSPSLADGLLLLLTSLLLHLLLLPLLCSHLPFSYYFQPPSSLPDEASQVQEAEHYLQGAGRVWGQAGGRTRLAVVMLTARRSGSPGYLTRSLASLLREVQGELEEPRVLICTGEEWGEHGELEHLQLHLPVLHISVNKSLVNNFKSKEQKAKADFTVCSLKVEEMLPREIEHILVLQDDVLMEGFFPTLR